MPLVPQTVTPRQLGAPLPVSTGQNIEQELADKIIAANLAVAPRLGYVVNGDKSPGRRE
jgi:hypothetical protein